MISFLAGIVGWVLVPVAVVAAAYAAGKLAARSLGVPDFRLLAAGKPGTGLRRFGVRAASTAGAFLVAWLLSFGAALSLGKTEPTMAIRVHEGPAKRAGLRDGDRIVAVDDRSVATWEAMRNAVQSGSGHTVTVERGGERVTVTVTPNAERRIGVEQQRLMPRPATVSESFGDAFATCFLPVRMIGGREPRERRTLGGPVGITRELRETRHATGGVLWMLAAIASFAWPVVLAFHAVDALLPSLRRLGR
ncbi:MAG TPA: PDZ domain-containing protein [Polyangiaceae bacterium]